VKPSNVPRNVHLKQKTRKHNFDVACRTRSKTEHLEQAVVDRTRSKLQAICNFSGQEVFFPLHDIFMIKGQENLKNTDLHLGASECQIHHSALIKSKSNSELDWLRQLHDWIGQRMTWIKPGSVLR
jgi:hypothetical protein